MNRIFPVRLDQYSSWIQENAQLLLDDPEVRKETKTLETNFDNDIVFYHQIPELPEDVVILQIGDKMNYSIVPTNFIEQFQNGAGINHFPVITPNEFRIIDSVGDDITSLYLTGSLKSKVKDLEYQITKEPKLAFLRGVLPNYAIWTSRTHYIEAIIDADEVVLYRAISPFKTCTISEKQLVFKLPGAPELRVEISQDASTDEHEIRVTYALPNSGVLVGSLLKIGISLFPIPHFQFIMSEGQINGLDFEDEEIPSYLLLSADGVSHEVLQEAGKSWTTEKIEAQRQKNSRIQKTTT